MRGRRGYIVIALIVCAVGMAVSSLLSPWAQTPLTIRRAPAASSSVSVTVRVVGKEKGGNLPDRFSLSQNYPNPFNPETLIEYSLPEDCQVELTIYNILGRKVKALVNEFQNAGYKVVHWDGRDDKGDEVGSGVYFYEIKADRYTDIKKMVILR